jgi:FKBP-type peptidyl-prolyl cis-trans isomerase
MKKLETWFLAGVVLVACGCHGEDEAADAPRPATKAEPRRVPQAQPPIDLKTPPKDAAKTASGLSYKRLVEKSNGLQARPDESVLIRYTGWRQSSGETFFNSGTDGRGITINPAYAAPAFREVIPLLHKGEQIMVWVPAGGGMPEPVVYEVELVDVVPKAAPSSSAWR